MIETFWRGKRVLVTGHTGFKGSWLCLWLQSAGAEVHGYALSPSTQPSMYDVAQVEERMASSVIADLADRGRVADTVSRAKPEIVLHLAAQPLVRASYMDPVVTYLTNVMGTVHLLEAVRTISGVRVLVNVTTDKCYENREWVWPYREDDAMGGHDPYSSSKACSELLTASYRRCFFGDGSLALATARAGNVIGGGDWTPDRLVPDILTGFAQDRRVLIRSPHAVRPWQHVLEPLSGYLSLAEHLWSHPLEFSEAWNFGPKEEAARSVRWIADKLAGKVGGHWGSDSDASKHPHEAGYLRLDSSKARARLNWQPRWTVEEALDRTLEWHAAWRSGNNMQKTSLAQISAYLAEQG